MQHLRRYRATFLDLEPATEFISPLPNHGKQVDIPST